VKTTTANLGESRYQIWAGARSGNSIRAHAPSADTPLSSPSYSAINLTTIYRQVQTALTEYVIRRIALLNSCKYVIYIQYHTQSVTVSTDVFAARKARMWDAVRWPNQLVFSVVRSTWRLYLSKSTSIREYFT